VWCSWLWFFAARSEYVRNSLIVALGPNDVTGEEKCRKTDDHQTPDGEYLPIQIIGFAWTRVALAFPIKVHISKVILLSLPVAFMDLPFALQLSLP
jgi:hypothetical protein